MLLSVYRMRQQSDAGSETERWQLVGDSIGR